MKKNLIIGIGIIFSFLVTLALTTDAGSGYFIYRDISIGSFLPSEVNVILSVIGYFYIALAYMRIAQKSDTENAWLAWVPIANLYLLSKIARAHWWPILLLGLLIPYMAFYASLAQFIIDIGPLFIIDIIPFFIISLFAFFVISWQWKIFERFKRPGWWSLSLLIPMIGLYINFVLLGIIAWGDSDFLRSKKGKAVILGIILFFVVGVFFIRNNFQKPADEEIYNFTESFVDYLYYEDGESLKKLMHPDSRDYFSLLDLDKAEKRVNDLISSSSAVFGETKPSFRVSDITGEKDLVAYFLEDVYYPFSPEKFLMISDSEDFTLLVAIAKLNGKWAWVPSIDREKAKN